MPDTCLANDDVLEGFVLAAKRMGMSDVYGILRGHVAEETSPEARKIIAALDHLEKAGVATQEPDLESLLQPQD